jgi:hypothetical protein
MNKIISDCFTGKDNQTYDIGRILWGLSVIVFLALSSFSCIKSSTWNPVDFGIGLGSVLAAGGVALGLKKSTEP